MDSFAELCEFKLPEWVKPWMDQQPDILPDNEQRMALAVALSAENIRQGTGGPFGAIVVEEESGRLLSVGMNLVTSSGLSIAHAEMVALSMAQQRAGDWNLAAKGGYQLVTSCEPCAMCFGAIPWSGVHSVLCGAAKSDAEAAGFDEGDKPLEWVAAFEARGIRVECQIYYEQAAAVLADYAASGGVIYNAG